MFLPKNILIRLVDTASLNINKQISIMKKTDYLFGIHGAGFTLSIFTPNTCIIHEILPNDNLVMIMESLSGHKIYSDETKVIKKNIILNQQFIFQLIGIPLVFIIQKYQIVNTQLIHIYY